MDRESYERAADLDSLPGTRLPTGRGLSLGELRALFEVCAADPSPVGRRDAALFALLREGLRRAEAAALQLEQVDLEAAEVRVGPLAWRPTFSSPASDRRNSADQIKRRMVRRARRGRWRSPRPWAGGGRPLPSWTS